MNILGLAVLLFIAFVVFRSAWSLVELVIAIAIWGIAGYLAGQITRGRGFGLFGNIAIGMLGAIVGNFLAYSLRLWTLVSIPLVGGIIVGVIGAIVVLLAVNLAVGKR